MNTILKMIAPTAKVSFSNVSIDAAKSTFSLTLGIKEGKQKKFRFEQVTGTISKDLREFFTLMRKEYVEIADASHPSGKRFEHTGAFSTSFERLCRHQGVPFTPGVLSTMTFMSDNDSKDRALNPFKLVRYVDGNSRLTLVNIAPQTRTITQDPVTLETKVGFKKKFYQNADGKFKPSFITPSYYRRLMVQTSVIVEPVDTEQAAPVHTDTVAN